MSDLQKRFAIKFELIADTLGDQFQKDFPAHVEGLIRSNPGNYIFISNNSAKNAEKFYEMKPRKDDVYVITFPKSGKFYGQ